jgi:hypothetical protein
VRWLKLALNAGLLFLAALVIYLWMVRLGSDLTWDEATNFRVYARNPVTAIGLYHEPNNHILDSFLKSVLVWGFGLDEPNVLRFAGFLYVAAYLAVGWALFRRLSRAGAIVTATVLALLLLLTRGFNYWATEMRGYFLSITLQFGYLLMLVRHTGLLGPPGAVSGEFTGPRPWDRKTVLTHALFSALIVAALPTNVIAVATTWLITVWAFKSAGSAPGRSPVRMYFELAVPSGILTILFYAPAALGIVFGISQFKSVHGHFSSDFARLARDEVAMAVTQLAPRGIDVAAFGWTLVALAAVACAAALRPGRRLTRLALLTIGASIVLRIVFAICFSYPSRARCALVPTLVTAIVLAVFDLTASWRQKAQVLISLVLVAGALALVPTLVREERPGRVASDIASLVEMDSHASGAHAVLVAGRDLEDPLDPLVRVVGRTRFVATPTELDSRFAGVPQESRHPKGSWKRWLRDAILPEDPRPPIDPAAVDYLVLIDFDPEHKEGQASEWSSPALAAIKKRLTRQTEYARADYRIRIFRMP